MARSMVTDYGMSDKLGPRTFGHKEEMVFLGREISEQRDYSEKVALQIDNEVQQIIETAYNTALDLITTHRDKLEQIARALLEEETLEGDDLERLLDSDPSKPTPRPVKKTKTPAPVKTVAEEAKEAAPKKAPGVPRLVPKQNPAPSE